MVKLFNDYRHKMVIPGPTLVIDELISPYEGMESTYATTGMPGKVSIKRKPRGIGIEIKAIADCQSGIITVIEIQEGKELMKDKKYVKEYNSGTAQCLRMFKNYKDTYRTCIMDAAFGSVKCLLAMHKLLGLYVIGSVKTAHKEFPKKYLEEWYKRININLQRGQHILLKSEMKDNDDEEQDIYAVGWADKKMFAFISNVSVTTAGILLIN